jgi:hypothetical protein
MLVRGWRWRACRGRTAAGGRAVLEVAVAGVDGGVNVGLRVAHSAALVHARALDENGGSKGGRGEEELEGEHGICVWMWGTDLMGSLLLSPVALMYCLHCS